MRRALIFIVSLGIAAASCSDDYYIVRPVDEIDEVRIGILRRTWYESSPPIDPDTEQIRSGAERAEQCWYCPALDMDYLVLYPCDLDPSRDYKNDYLISLMISVVEPEPGQWSGIMRGFPEGLDLSRAQYLEVWVNDFQPDSLLRRGTLHIEFGLIDEDFHRPELDEFDDEDQWPYGWTGEEDTGFGGDDDCQYPQEIIFNHEYYIYKNINCRAANGVWDTEDLNKNGYLDMMNAYYHVEIDLAATAVIDIQRDYSKETYAGYWSDVDRSNHVKAWRLYRIDRTGIFTRIIPPNSPAPRLDSIQHMRIWIDEPADLDGLRGSLVQIGSIRFVNE